MLYVIGLGLSDEKDITVKGLEVSLREQVDVWATQTERDFTAGSQTM